MSGHELCTQTEFRKYQPGLWQNKLIPSISTSLQGLPRNFKLGNALFNPHAGDPIRQGFDKLILSSNPPILGEYSVSNPPHLSSQSQNGLPCMLVDLWAFLLQLNACGQMPPTLGAKILVKSPAKHHLDLNWVPWGLTLIGAQFIRLTPLSCSGLTGNEDEQSGSAAVEQERTCIPCNHHKKLLTFCWTNPYCIQANQGYFVLCIPG